jgi:hypothetical protein
MRIASAQYKYTAMDMIMTRSRYMDEVLQALAWRFSMPSQGLKKRRAGSRNRVDLAISTWSCLKNERKETAQLVPIREKAIKLL